MVLKFNGGIYLSEVKNAKVKYIHYNDLLTDSSVSLIKIKFLNDKLKVKANIHNKSENNDENELNYDNRNNNFDKKLVESFKKDYYNNTLEFINKFLILSDYCSNKENLKFDVEMDIRDKINSYSNSSFPFCLKPKDKIDYKKTIVVRTRV